jgi:transposase
MSAGKRDLKKESFWRRAIIEQSGSGVSVRRWCRKHGLTEASFHWWRRELRQRDAEPRSMSLVPVHVTDDRPRDGQPRIEIVLTDGRRVGLHGPVDRQALVDVLAVLSSSSADPELGPTGSIHPEYRSC